MRTSSPETPPREWSSCCGMTHVLSGRPRPVAPTLIMAAGVRLCSVWGAAMLACLMLVHFDSVVGLPVREVRRLGTSNVLYGSQPSARRTTK